MQASWWNKEFWERYGTQREAGTVWHIGQIADIIDETTWRAGSFPYDEDGTYRMKKRCAEAGHHDWHNLDKPKASDKNPY
jgi:hypothetical protein